MKKILSLILLFSFIQQTAFSIEDIHKVYLKDAIDTALKNNIDLRAAKIDIDIAKIILHQLIVFKILHLMFL